MRSLISIDFESLCGELLLLTDIIKITNIYLVLFMQGIKIIVEYPTLHTILIQRP